MRVLYRGRQAKQAAVYEQGPVTFCCAEMCRWWGRLIGFGAKDCLASTSREVNLYLVRAQASGAGVVELVSVDFCPWCGGVIELCREK
jgi:hypothetical protein